ncbi:MAG: hypothetical protein WBC04_13455 [Candidatus Acidiferrales bacterium]
MFDLIARGFGQFNKPNAYLFLGFTYPHDLPACFDPVLGSRQTEAYAWEEIAVQGLSGSDGHSVLNDIENDTAVIAAQLNVYQRSGRPA